MKYKLTFALVAFMTSTAFAAFQAPLPEFKNEKQLAEWRAEKASESTSQGYAAEETAFYTGKPYLASANTYAFKYRNYDSGLARWTSEDPSGFPDGANGYCYVNNESINSFDSFGLSKQVIKQRWFVWVNNIYSKSYEEVAGFGAVGGVSAGLGVAALATNPAGWVVGGAVVGVGTVSALAVYGVGKSEAGNKAREDYPMWSGGVSGGKRIMSGDETLTKPDEFEVRNYVTGYEVDGKWGALSEGFKYDVKISYDRYILE